MNNLDHSQTLETRLLAAALLLAGAGSVLADVRYVDVTSTNATPPYTNWITAATNIQDAVDASVAGDEIVVTNGIYATGGGAAGFTGTRVNVDKALSLRSMNGPRFTTIDGGGSNSCVHLANGASLSGFTLTDGAVFQRGWGSGGGGVSCESTAAVVSNCVLVGNSSDSGGGGASYGTLNNCTLSSNSGGAAAHCTLHNCTLTGNSGGGASASTLVSCIVYFNQGENYDSSSSLNYCCTTPQPTNGVGNISLDPQLASSSHLSAASPCRGAGDAAYASGTDVDGGSWASPPSIGCDEYHVGAVTGALSVGAAAAFTNVAIGFTVQFIAGIEGQTTASVWDFGDGVTVTNHPYTAHAWTALGDYGVSLRAYNETQPGGISTTVAVHVVAQPVHYVAAGSANPVAPYRSWATAATDIQDAVDAATVPGALVLVTNGLYATGGRDGNRLTVGKILSVQSINGPQFTTIDGGHSNRCVHLADSAALSGFTLTNGSAQLAGDPYWSAEDIGGGLWCASRSAVVSNCVVSGNSAVGGPNPYLFGGSLIGAAGGGVWGGTLNNCVVSANEAVGFWLDGQVGGYGGGAAAATLNNCTITGNAAFRGSLLDAGGGAYGCTLNNCTVSGNSAADSGGGAEACSLDNCIVYFNTAFYAPGGSNYDSCILNYCCTMPQPTDGLGNITNAPLFVGTNGWADLRLQSNSPCINAGLNALAPVGLDLDGNPRIKGGTVDIGAYEYQVPTSLISYAWLQQFGLPTDGSADTADPDGDGMNNWQEWRCGTDPTNALSALRLLAPAQIGPDLVVRWESVAYQTYFLERSTTASSGFTPLAAGIPGQPGMTSYTDTNAIGAGPWFYRVGVSTP